MKLKTLKDMECIFDHQYGTYVNMKNDRAIMLKDLKAEAIKWLKDDSEDISSWKENFKAFHNITEEDLDITSTKSEEKLKYDRNFNLTNTELEILKRLNKKRLVYKDYISNNMRIWAIRETMEFLNQDKGVTQDE